MCCEFRKEKLHRRLLLALIDIVVYMTTIIHNNEKYQIISSVLTKKNAFTFLKSHAVK